MSNRDWPPGDDVVPKEKNKIDEIADRILADDKLKQILALYTEGFAIKASKIDKTNIGEEIVKFLKEYDNRDSFLAVNAKIKYRYSDTEGLLEKFAEAVYGPRMKAEGLETMMTQEFPVLERPDFKPRSELKPSEAKRVEFRIDISKICHTIITNQRFRGILAEFVKNDFKFRNQIDLTNVADLLNEFLVLYPTLAGFEAAVHKDGSPKIKTFLDSINKPREYKQAIMDFEDLMYGNHKER